jgi:hypothetical protein
MMLSATARRALALPSIADPQPHEATFGRCVVDLPLT